MIATLCFPFFIIFLRFLYVLTYPFLFYIICLVAKLFFLQNRAGRDGEIGRRRGLKILRSSPSVPVQVRFPAPEFAKQILEIVESRKLRVDKTKTGGLRPSGH